MSRARSPVPCADCGRPKGRTKSPRCARCRARRGRQVAAAGKRAWRDRVAPVPHTEQVPQAAPEEDEFTLEELLFEPPNEANEPAQPLPAPISHVSPPPSVEVRPRQPPAGPEPEVPAEPDYIADAHTTDLTRWIQDSSQPLEVRRRVRDELMRREPFAEEGWELDAIRWVLATHGRRL